MIAATVAKIIALVVCGLVIARLVTACLHALYNVPEKPPANRGKRRSKIAVHRKRYIVPASDWNAWRKMMLPSEDASGTARERLDIGRLQFSDLTEVGMCLVPDGIRYALICCVNWKGDIQGQMFTYSHLHHVLRFAFEQDEYVVEFSIEEDGIDGE